MQLVEYHFEHLTSKFRDEWKDLVPNSLRLYLPTDTLNSFYPLPMPKLGRGFRSVVYCYVSAVNKKKAMIATNVSFVFVVVVVVSVFVLKNRTTKTLLVWKIRGEKQTERKQQDLHLLFWSPMCVTVGTGLGWNQRQDSIQGSHVTAEAPALDPFSAASPGTQNFFATKKILICQKERGRNLVRILSWVL